VNGSSHLPNGTRGSDGKRARCRHFSPPAQLKPVTLLYIQSRGTWRRKGGRQVRGRLDQQLLFAERLGAKEGRAIEPSLEVARPTILEKREQGKGRGKTSTPVPMVLRRNVGKEKQRNDLGTEICLTKRDILLRREGGGNRAQGVKKTYESSSGDQLFERKP